MVIVKFRLCRERWTCDASSRGSGILRR